MISMLILARILTPDDFGLVAICTLAVFLFNSLSEVGAKQYIIRSENVDNDVINTAWTLNIVIKGSIWLIFFISTPYIAEVMGKAEIEAPLRVLSIILVIGCFGNPEVWIMARDLNYKPLFKVDVYSKVFSFTIVLLIAYFERTYWAMIVGLVLQYLLPSIFSHFICSHKPRFKLINMGHQIKFSQWVVANSIVGFARGEGDSLLVAKYFNLEMIGVYSIFKNLSSMPLTQLIAPATDPLLATFSSAIRDDDFQPYQLNTVLLLLLSLVIPLTVLMTYFNQEIVLLLLGDKWVEHAYILPILACMMIPGVIFKVLSEYVLAEGGYKPIVYYQICMTVITLAILFMVIGSDLESFSKYRVLISFVSLLVFCTYFQIKFKLFQVSDVFLFMLPLLASVIAVLVIINIDFTSLNWFVRLIVGCSIFSVIYSFLLLSLVYLNRQRYECTLFLSYLRNVMQRLRR